MEIQYDYISVCIIGLWLKRGDDGSNLTVVYIDILISWSFLVMSRISFLLSA